MSENEKKEKKKKKKELTECIRTSIRQYKEQYGDYDDLNEEEKEEAEEEARAILNDALEVFKLQYDADLNATGYVTGGTVEEIYQREYWVKDLIESKVEQLNIEIGGWFEIDKRNARISCLLSFKLNGEEIGDCEGILGEYDQEKGEWSLRWDSY